MEYPEYYRILELPVDAELGEIKKQYRKLAKKYHPDMNPDDKMAEEKFKKLKEAYEILINESKRAAYDMEWKKKRDTERAARKKESRENPKSEKQKNTKKKEPVKKTDVTLKEKNKSENKKEKKANNKHKISKIFRIFISLTVFSVALLILTKRVDLYQSKIPDITGKTAELLSDINEFAGGISNHFLRHEIQTNDVNKARTIIKEAKEKSPTDENIVNIKNSDGYTLLMMAQTPEMSKMLIENGADVNYQSPDGKTALLLAIERDSSEQVRILLEAKANPDIKSPDNRYSALMIAKSEEIAYLLLKSGANPNYIAPDGITALSKATAEHNRERLNLLQQFGAQINWSDVITKH